MPYLIDGNNLIGHLPFLEIKTRESRFELIGRLLVFQKIKNYKTLQV